MHKALRVLRENCANPLYMWRRNESASIYRMKKIIVTPANCMQSETRTINFSGSADIASHDRMVALVTQMRDLNKKPPLDPGPKGRIEKDLPLPRLHEPVVLSCIVPHYRYIQHLPVSPASPLHPTTGTPGPPGQTPSQISWACSNAPEGWHTFTIEDTGSSGNHGQPGRLMRVRKKRFSGSTIRNLYKRYPDNANLKIR